MMPRRHDVVENPASLADARDHHTNFKGSQFAESGGPSIRIGELRLGEQAAPENDGGAVSRTKEPRISTGHEET
jgi:hypothetical protein